MSYDVLPHEHSQKRADIRSLVGWVTSAVLLAAAIVTWPELFIDVKVIHPPAWAAFLPQPLLVLLIVPGAALLPAALLPRTAGRAGIALTFAMLVGAIASPVYEIYRRGVGDHLLGSMFTHYAHARSRVPPRSGPLVGCTSAAVARPYVAGRCLGAVNSAR